MAQDSITRCFGLITEYNSLSVQPGALIKAENCRISRENVIENRRGHSLYGLTGSHNPSQFMTYSKRVLVNSEDKIYYDNGSGTFAAYSGSYSAITANKMRSAEERSNLYVTTDSGIKVIEGIAGATARDAGAPRGLFISAVTTGASGFLLNNEFVGYRYTVRRLDANDNVLFGFPSEKHTVQNTAGADRNIIATCYITSDVKAGDEVLLYRTETAVTDAVGDEMRLVYVHEVTSTDVTNKYVTITDVVIDELRESSEPLYTNAAQETIAQGNTKPPLARDISLYKSRFMMFANTEDLQRLFTTLVTVPGAASTMVISGLTFTFDAAENAVTKTIQRYTAGTTAQNIENTAKSMVRVINQCDQTGATATINAFYLSQDNDLPGQILIEAKSLGAATFTITSSSLTTQFSPSLASVAGSKTTSSSDRRKNGLSYSKDSQPEHVPLPNYELVGPANTEILRVAALRDSLIIIKEEGVYRLTGDEPSSFTIVPLDLTVKCKARNSVTILNNQVFMLSNQGVVMINDTGVEVISGTIEPDIIPKIALPLIDSLCYAYAYESDHSYFLSMPQNSSDTVNTVTYVYHAYTKTWVKDTFGISAGIVEDSMDRAYFARPSIDDTVFRERKDFSFSDHSDPEYAITLTAIDGDEVSFTVSGTGAPSVGDAIKQGTTAILIESVTQNGAIYDATLRNPAPVTWALASASIFPSVKMSIQWAAWSGGNPDLLKQVRQFDVYIDNIPGNANPSSIESTFVTDYQSQQDVDIISQADGWDTSPWGEFPWGGIKDTHVFSTWVPVNNQYCRLMNPGVDFNNALERVAITGCGFTFNPISERVSK